METEELGGCFAIESEIGPGVRPYNSMGAWD